MAVSWLVAPFRSRSPASGVGSWKKSQARSRLAMAVVLALAVLFPAACRPGEERLHFETIERHYHGAGMLWEAREPGLMILTSWDELGPRDKLFTAQGQASLYDMDWQTSFAVAAFLGWQGSSHEGIWIDRIDRRGTEVSVAAHAGRPGGLDVVTSPYHLVAVEKEGEWGQEIRFTLYLGGQPVASESHFIP
ncbi:MAG: hypothetical protein JXM73_06890 [Anaerolineae bacterium]|nr:hypothetical protein [Anaerolineae bacterium]